MSAVTIVDDFGTESGFTDGSENRLLSFVRFAIDGKGEGITSGLLSGNVDEESLRGFGLIA